MTLSLFTASLLLLSILVGLIPALVDAIRKPIESRLGIPEGHADWFVRIFYLTWLPAMPLFGWILDEVGGYQRGILFFAQVTLILAVAWLAMVRTHRSLLFNAVVLGCAYSMLTVGVVRLMTTAFFTQPNPSAGLNIGFVAVGLGALLGPVIVRFIAEWWGYRHGLLYVSVAMIAPAALTVLWDRSVFDTGPLRTWDQIVAHPHIALVIGIILVYFAIENCLEFWPEAYLKELGYRDRRLQFTMTGFWLLFIAARAGAAWWLYHHPDHAVGLTLLLVFLAAMVLGNLVSGYEVGSGTFVFLLLGICYGPLLPCMLGITLELYDDRLPASALGALLALSGLDTLVVRPMMGYYAKDRPARTVMRVPTVLALLLGAPLVLMLFLRY